MRNRSSFQIISRLKESILFFSLYRVTIIYAKYEKLQIHISRFFKIEYIEKNWQFNIFLSHPRAIIIEKFLSIYFFSGSNTQWKSFNSFYDFILILEDNLTEFLKMSEKSFIQYSCIQCNLNYFYCSCITYRNVTTCLYGFLRIMMK